ncbi:hypothetical protein H112_07515 [Trichophyton rubrum D6]|uniref:Uncharacterized protein n=3 Tax=Trichophyton TaxID=5550 RepID=A0A087PFG8_TRIRC|nr:uncharacterized protein TERG_11517 [Trichophyton rubrum CBS 118892]EZF11325.1 hypothetical protein H100_07542 [Trichophyton rubrum MR850]EZF38149.1 hypothetical protein H102_07505 [Trichophyton rubrum CBS 100081]EZF48860.1 hypothetical protein H103_07528 [Trichophyton rubrum CBS 288.86]EZF59494.1 hypothetical protein H104_07476 [Trichophyton rubrum CBS 289.86]EZF70005.1 hypothetical protein H105_07533 [Trichophyton soudanense CBS 452.61]EZF80852.1 hypothetical protein H110_07522 [Trichophy
MILWPSVVIQTGPKSELSRRARKSRHCPTRQPGWIARRRRTVCPSDGCSLLADVEQSVVRAGSKLEKLEADVVDKMKLKLKLPRADAGTKPARNFDSPIRFSLLPLGRSPPVHSTPSSFISLLPTPYLLFPSPGQRLAVPTSTPGYQYQQSLVLFRRSSFPNQVSEGEGV